MSGSPQKIPIDLIVFDLDGTLADSLPDLAAAANHTCRTLGLPEHSPADIMRMIGGGEKKFVERFLGPGHQGYVEQALGIYFDRYSRHCGQFTRLYAGVRETLEALAGKELAVLSNKNQALTEKVLEVMGIRHFFAAMRGGGGDLALKPSPEPLIALIRDLGRDPRRTLMVGDKTADVLTGRGAGAYTAALTCGYGDPADLLAAAPDFIINRISELPGLVQ